MSAAVHRRARWSASAVALVLLALVLVLATRSTAPGTETPSSLGGKLAPPISGIAIGSGKQITLSSFRGRFVVVDFFASWCAPCIAEVPELTRFLFEHRAAKDVAVLGIDIEDSRANGRAFLTRVGATWPAIEDGSGQLAESYGVVDPPQSFLVDPQGRVVATFGSGVTAAQLDGLIAAARDAASS